jgi:large subunit ribosomal protein L1
MKMKKAKKEKYVREAKQEAVNPFLSSIIKARQSSKPRNFTQTWDFLINVKGLNMKKPENRFNVDVVLPKGRGREPKVAIFADSIATEAGKVANVIVRKEEISQLLKDKKRLDEVMGCDIFLGEASLMALIGKELGPTLAPRSKMPRPLPPSAKLDAFVAASKRSLRVALKENPTIHLAIGNDKMPDEDIVANAEAIFNVVKDRMPKGLNNVKSVYIKLTMGRPVKVAVK